MKTIATYLTEQECIDHIDRHNLDNVLIERSVFTGRFDILDLE